MALLSRFVRRILGYTSFPLVPVPLDKIEPQVYQPPAPTPTPTPPPTI